MGENDEEIESNELDFEKKLETKSNLCKDCPNWENWKFLLPKKEQRNPHPIDGNEECENCPDRTD